MERGEPTNQYDQQTRGLATLRREHFDLEDLCGRIGAGPG
jgi:hypothetical protein